ncbi:T9SS type A sorting domain-containing protein [candidate division WOR-3 bacterium]|nr:T9SS type A sorting domain-containing protein [candidate division WOR-3 bacterium]
MFLIVLLSVFAEWEWVDESAKIDLGLEYTPYSTNDVEFLDLDQDTDQDMLMIISSDEGGALKAYENISTDYGHCWQENPSLIEGIELSGPLHSLGSADFNSDGKVELVIMTGFNEFMDLPTDVVCFADRGVSGAPLWKEQTAYFQGLDEEYIPAYPDFTDIDGDGDEDMVALFGPYPRATHWHALCLWRNTGKYYKPEWEMDSLYFRPGYGDYYYPAQSPEWVDWEGDGDQDVIFSTWVTATPPPYGSMMQVLVNEGSPISPLWNEEHIYERYIFKAFTTLDWNQDKAADILVIGGEYDEGYHFFPGKRSSTGLEYDFGHPFIWGGISAGGYPTAADVNDDGIPEVTLSEQVLMMELINNPGLMEIEVFKPFLRQFSAAEEDRSPWQRTGANLLHNNWKENLETTPVHIQYVDFCSDERTDYVFNLDGKNTLYRNKGSKSNPSWVKDEEALKDLPLLFPTCFLDADADGDKDVIGTLKGESILAGFTNTYTDGEPRYVRDDLLVSGLEEVAGIHLASGDLDEDGRVDLAGTSNSTLSAYLNTGLQNPRWERHPEVFSKIGDCGAPAIFDADSDGDLDLFLAKGSLHYYRNESTGGIAETRPEISRLTTVLAGKDREIRLAVDPEVEVQVSVYDAAGQRVKEVKKVPDQGVVSFRFQEPSGVYFCRLKQDERISLVRLVVK